MQVTGRKLETDVQNLLRHTYKSMVCGGGGGRPPSQLPLVAPMPVWLKSKFGIEKNLVNVTT